MERLALYGSRPSLEIYPWWPSRGDPIICNGGIFEAAEESGNFLRVGDATRPSAFAKKILVTKLELSNGARVHLPVGHEGANVRA